MIFSDLKKAVNLNLDLVVANPWRFYTYETVIGQIMSKYYHQVSQPVLLSLIPTSQRP